MTFVFFMYSGRVIEVRSAADCVDRLMNIAADFGTLRECKRVVVRFGD